MPGIAVAELLEASKIQVVRLLLERSADVNALDKKRQDPFPVHDATGDLRTTF